jgi:hypothetical protein
MHVFHYISQGFGSLNYKKKYYNNFWHSPFSDDSNDRYYYQFDTNNFYLIYNVLDWHCEVLVQNTKISKLRQHNRVSMKQFPLIIEPKNGT